MAEISTPKLFDPNEDQELEALVRGSTTSLARFPVYPNTFSVQEYADAYSQLPTVMEKSEWGALAKVGTTGIVSAPEMQSFARISTMPNTFYRGLVQWPDLPAATLKKIGNDHLIVHTIVQQRVADILRYAERSSHPWKPGWRIELREGLREPSSSDMVDIRDAERFTENCCFDPTWDPRKRDAMGLTSFARFLAGSMRDTERYDGVAWWTDMDVQGRVRAFRALPASNILLATREGYEGRKEVFACGVDEAGTVVHQFTRNSLTWLVRNDRTDAEAYGYGYPEIAMLVKIIQAFTNAFEMNADVFTKSAIPPGLLKLKGMWTQRQVDVISRIWGNLMRGATKKWALPALPIPKDGDIELLDLSRMSGNEAYYQDFVNMLAGLACAIWQFPTTRLGYRISGKGRNSETKEAIDPAAIVDEEDPGLSPRLNMFQNSYNQYILWTRWPNLQLRFLGKNPKEDAREYEAKKNASTLNQMRALADEKPLQDTVANAEHKEMAELMGMTPVDPGLAGVWQAIVSPYMASKYAKPEGGSPEAEIRPSTDPARSEGHGHQSGVRRGSAREKGKTAS